MLSLRMAVSGCHEKLCIFVDAATILYSYLKSQLESFDVSQPPLPVTVAGAKTHNTPKTFVTVDTNNAISI